MTPVALLLALHLAVADPCGTAPEACRIATKEAILTWRTSADLRGAALERCTQQLQARTATATLALAEAAAARPTPEPGWSTSALVATGAGGALLGALGAVIAILLIRH